MRAKFALIPLVAAALALAGCAASGGETPAEPTDSAPTGADAPLYDLLPDDIKEAGVITMAGDTHPPYRTIESDGAFTGIDPDLQAALSAQLGVPFEMATSSGLDAMLTGMLSGRYDGFNGPVRATPEREADFDAIVWMTTRTSYVYPADKEKDFPDSEAVCGKRVAGVQGSVVETQLERLNEWCVAEGLDPAELIGLEDTNSTVLAMNSGRADLVGTTQASAIDLIATQAGKYGYVMQTDEQGAGVDQLAMFLPKGSGLAEPMMAAFEAIFEDGQYGEIMAAYGIEEASVDKPVLNPYTG
ncbi:transporter substrate-binding domain-containing protein [Microbacterium caowuchunii]|uniref:transporter substrate-binding domain-containing protein n=1 Tax=Microbacterium caowuchunii TaxID=2614638 RepID=UPI0012470689|nr:transporter substrate-binding domain-containing protein [Microbacterium caowuchunii]QEW01169.1 transporter substrate-binding domain-containing protein [Microbacterium caowuchunii]